MLDADGVLVDGRNRLRACEMAGVEPTFAQLNGHDAAAFIKSANIDRRNLTKGQRAMALAMLYPDGGIGGRGKRGNPAENAGFSERRLQHARLILRHSPPLAKAVLSGTTSIDLALGTVENERRALEADDVKPA